MRRVIGIILLGSALALSGCATGGSPQQKADATRPLIKCSTCGAEFTSSAGMEDHLKSHPDHQTAAAGTEPTPLVRCSTCGTSFTSQAEVTEHLKTHPTHKVAPVQRGQHPLIKCSTCGVEFTSSAEAEDHIRAHPQHKLAEPEPAQ